ncbi:hypothetical protein V5799_024858 [Amblyomma americanum]|uniref:Uncharacterized protein n=1 Tax=Amblyomma americanum TaxID=6943 RepID=A0AAQ4EBB7_AMBAM
MEPCSPQSWYAPQHGTFGSRPQAHWLPLVSKEPARPGILKSRKSLAYNGKQQPPKTLCFSVDPWPATPTTQEVTGAVGTEAPSTTHSPTLTSEEERPPSSSEAPLSPLQSSEHSEALSVATDEQTEVGNSSEPSHSKSNTSAYSEANSAKLPSAAGESAASAISGSEGDTGPKQISLADRSASHDNRKKRVMRWFQQEVKHRCPSHDSAGDSDGGSVTSPFAFGPPLSGARSYAPQEDEALNSTYPRCASMAILAGLLLFLVVAATTTLHQSLSGSDRDTAADRDNTLAPMGIAEENAGWDPPRVYNGVDGGEGPKIAVRSRPREDSKKDEPADKAEDTAHRGLSTDVASTTGDLGEGHKLADVQEITGSWSDASLLASGPKVSFYV